MATKSPSRARLRVKLLLVLLSICTASGFLAAPQAQAGAVGQILSVPGVISVDGGLKQLTAAVNDVSGAVNGLGVIIQGLAAPNVEAQVTALQARIAEIQSDIAGLDTTAALDDANGAVAALQAQVLGLALSTGLTSGLSIAQNVLSPVCSLAAVPTSFVPGIGMDLSRVYKLKSPEIQQTDATTDKLIKDTYNTVYAQVIALLSANATTAAVPGLLVLLKFDWTTVYQQPDGTTITKTAPGLINIPTPIDVDNSGTFDVCAMASYALDPSGAVILKQTVTKMPLAKATLPLKISAPMLANLLNVGYDTTTQPAFDTDPAPTVDNSRSTAPVSYGATTVYSATAGLKFDTALAVHRGTTLTVPPVNATAPLPALPQVPPLTAPAPTPKITQSMCLATCPVIEVTNRYDNPANDLHVTTAAIPTAAPLSAMKLNFTGNIAGGVFKFNYSLLGGAIGAFVRSAPSPTSLAFCSNTSNGSCSTAPHAATDKGSLSFLSSSPIRLDSSTAPATTDCAAKSDTHVDGSRLTMSSTPATASTAGKAFVDSGNQPISGCVGFPAAATGIPTATFASGSKASGRDATYHVAGTTLVPDAKSGTVTCPTGTAFAQGSATLSPVVCPVLPVLTSGPSITGETVMEAPLTAQSVWSPVADSPTVPNSPTVTYQWLRCDGAGTVCGPKAGATSAVYTPDADDVGHAFKVVVKGTNLDGSLTSLPSAATAAIATQSSAPGVINPPTISGIAGTGRTLTANSSKLTDWSHGVSGALGYQWQKCDSAGANCLDIAGATGGTYGVVYPDDLNSTIQVVVTATNSVGSTSATSAQQRIQPAAINTAIGKIQRCLNSACSSTADIPTSPFTGDKLKVSDGTWQAGTATGFLYQWNRCDEVGANCAPIGGATTNRYTVSKTDDLGKTLQVTVSGINDNLDAAGVVVKTPSQTPATAVVTPAKPAVQIGPAVDGVVTSVVGSNHDTTYLGGAFDTAGPAVGGAGAMGLAAGATQGQVVNGAAVTGGVVKAITSDLLSGYFIGGDFTQVQNVPCPSFAHIAASGVLDTSYCGLGIVGEVRSLLVVNGTYGAVLGSGADALAGAGYRVAVGGAFTAPGRGELHVRRSHNEGHQFYDCRGPERSR